MTADERLVRAMNARPLRRAVAVRLVSAFAAYHPWEWPVLPRWRRWAAHLALEQCDRLLGLEVGTTWAAVTERRTQPTPTREGN